MTQATMTTNRPVSADRRPWRLSRGAILVLGVFVIPLALSAALNAYGALTLEGALRMAAATVAGQTIAVVCALGVVVLTVRRGFALPSTLAFALIAALVLANALASIGTAGELLLSRLDLLAEMDALNG